MRVMRVMRVICIRHLGILFWIFPIYYGNVSPALHNSI